MKIEMSALDSSEHEKARPVFFEVSYSGHYGEI